MYQSTTIVGNLGSAPEMRYMPDGTAVTSFSVATNPRWADRQTGQDVDETTWFRVSVWGRMAEVCNQYLDRGSKVLVNGRLKPDPNTGGPRTYARRDGTVGASFELQANEVKFLSSRSESGNGGAGSTRRADAEPVTEEDEIPF